MSKESKEKQINGVIPQARDFVKELMDRRGDPIIVQQPYGHAVVNLANSLGGYAVLPHSTEKEQLRTLRNGALELIEEFGPNILNVMRHELKLALTEEDLEIIESGRRS